MINEIRYFGWKSKVLGVISPGAWLNKEAAKYAYKNEADYLKNRSKHAWHGAFAPVQAARKLRIARKMNKEGKSEAEIRKIFDQHKKKHAIAESMIWGGYSVIPGGLPLTGLVHAGLGGLGIAHSMRKDRKKFK